MKFYLAGKYDDRAHLHEYIKELEVFGYTVTHDWTIVDPTIEDAEARAEKDIDGVAAADWVICVMTDPKYPYRGTCTELGAAIALKKNIIIVNPDPKADHATSVFYRHHRVKHLNTWEEARDFLGAAKSEPDAVAVVGIRDLCRLGANLLMAYQPRE
jgi:nucleoside 2-deoxyribosyltransferase